MNSIGKWLDELEASIRFNRLSKKSSWKIKKYTRVNGDVFFRCYRKNFWKVWIVIKESDGYQSEPRDFHSEEKVKEYVKEQMESNRLSYLYQNGSKIAKVEVLRSKQEKRQDNIDKVLK